MIIAVDCESSWGSAAIQSTLEFTLMSAVIVQHTTPVSPSATHDATAIHDPEMLRNAATLHDLTYRWLFPRSTG